MRRPGIEPGSTAWKAAMLTIIPPTLLRGRAKNICSVIKDQNFNCRSFSCLNTSHTQELAINAGRKKTYIAAFQAIDLGLILGRCILFISSSDEFYLEEFWDLSNKHLS